MHLGWGLRFGVQPGGGAAALFRVLPSVLLSRVGVEPLPGAGRRNAISTKCYRCTRLESGWIVCKGTVIFLGIGVTFGVFSALST